MSKKAGRLLLVLHYLLYGFIYSGWLCHRSQDAKWFIYSTSYMIFLAIMAVPLLVPIVMRLMGWRMPWRRIGFALVPTVILLIVLYVILAQVYYHRQEHLFDPFVQVPPVRLPAEHETKAEGTFRILTLGGSTTGGDRYLTDQTRYPGVLQELLSARYPARKIEVFNAGRGWYTSRHSLINYATYYQDWHPDVVIVMHGINDLVRSFSPPYFAVGEYDGLYTHFYGPSINGALPPTFEAKVGEVIGRLTLKPRQFWFSNAIPRTIAVDYPPERYHSIASLEGNLRKIIRLAKANGSRVVLVTQPSLYRADMSNDELRALMFPGEFCATKRNFMQVEVPSAASMARAMKAYTDVTRRLAAEEQVTLCEGEPAVEKILANFVDDCHYTPPGARKLATAVEEAVVKAGLIENGTTGSAVDK